jgi:hypothetical protein
MVINRPLFAGSTEVIGISALCSGSGLVLAPEWIRPAPRGPLDSISVNPSRFSRSSHNAHAVPEARVHTCLQMTFVTHPHAVGLFKNCATTDL